MNEVSFAVSLLCLILAKQQEDTKWLYALWNLAAVLSLAKAWLV